MPHDRSEKRVEGIVEPRSHCGVQTSRAQWTKRDLVEVAKCQRSVLLIILLEFVATFLLMILANSTVADVGIWAAVVPSIVVGIIGVYFVYKLAVAIRSSAPWVYIILMFISVVSFIALLCINAEASRILKDHGIKVGFMGARMTDFDKIQ